MHSIELGNGVPAFLIKLWKLVEDPESSELICWSPSGLSFIIHDQSKFSKELLPLYFKHNNMASFIRQLNMYGFRKVMNVEQGRLRGAEHDDVEFYHQYFMKGKIKLLEFIKRKVSNSRTAVTISPAANNTSNNSSNNGDSREENVQLAPESVQDILSSLRSKQESVDSQLHNMKQENEALWREVAYLRQKHIKQQQIVDKLIHFLVSLVQPKRNISVKRKMPLMLQDSSDSVTCGVKAPRLSRQFSNKNSVSICSPKGPVIHDVTDFLTSSPCPVSSPSLEEDYTETVSPVVHIPSPESFVNSPLGTEEHLEPLSILDPLQNIEPVSPAEVLNIQEKEGPNVDATDPIMEAALAAENKETPEENKSDQTQESHMQVALSDSSPLSSFSSLNTFCGLDTSKHRDLLSDHLEGVESELSWLQEQLSNGTPFNLDTSALLGLFSSDDTVPGSNLPTDPLAFSGSEVIGNELMQYVPSLLDLEAIEEEIAPESPGPSNESLQSLLQKSLMTPVVEMQHPFENLQS